MEKMDLEECSLITDATIIHLAMNCARLEKLVSAHQNATFSKYWFDVFLAESITLWVDNRRGHSTSEHLSVCSWKLDCSWIGQLPLHHRCLIGPFDILLQFAANRTVWLPAHHESRNSKTKSEFSQKKFVELWWQFFVQNHLPNIKVHAYFAPVTPPPATGVTRQRFCRCCVVLWAWILRRREDGEESWHDSVAKGLGQDCVALVEPDSRCSLMMWCFEDLRPVDFKNVIKPYGSKMQNNGLCLKIDSCC